MRTFIAIEIPEQVKRMVEQFEDGLNERISDVKWVAPRNLHLTIKFLGEIPESQVDQIAVCVDRMAAQLKPFAIELAHLGFFPNAIQPRVIWVGANGGVDHLLELYQDLEDCMESIGIDREAKMFSPHLTIGRVKRNARITVPTGLPEFVETSFDVNGVALIKSTLTPEGPFYEKLHVAAFPQFTYQEQ